MGRFGGTSGQVSGIASVYKPILSVVITAGSPVLIWTPATGKKFRLMGWRMSLSVAGHIRFYDTSGWTEIWRSEDATAGAPIEVPPGFGNGILAAATNQALALDVSATGTVSGGVFGTEE